MNIVIGLFVIISAVVLRRVYKVRGKVSNRIFKMCMALGVFMLFSVQTFGNGWLIAMSAAEVLLCGLLLAVYRAQLIRECEAVRRKAARRAAARKNASSQVAVRRRVMPNAA